MTKILFVCLGNICRSPTAEGVFRRLVERAGLADQVVIDSAGTAAWHIGKSPDARATVAAATRGYDLSGLRGRQVCAADFVTFDYVLAMDEANLANLLDECPPEYRAKVRLFLSFSSRWPGQAVPDPYYGGADGFDHVLDMVEDAAEGVLRTLQGRTMSA